MKVGKNNFKPPPAVESSVVRLVPKNPRPAISYEEWDGLLRIAFVRKNKMLRSNFLGTTCVMDMLEGNYRTWCARNDVAVDDGPVEDVEMGNDVQEQDAEEEEWGGIMDVDDQDDENDVPAFFKEEEAALKLKKLGGNSSKRKKRGKIAEMVREKVRAVLEDETKLADTRARMCDEGDFLKLLWSFNQKGIHFG